MTTNPLYVPTSGETFALRIFTFPGSTLGGNLCRAMNVQVIPQSLSAIEAGQNPSTTINDIRIGIFISSFVIADRIRHTVPQPTERERVGN